LLLLALAVGLTGCDDADPPPADSSELIPTDSDTLEPDADTQADQDLNPDAVEDEVDQHDLPEQLDELELDDELDLDDQDEQSDIEELDEIELDQVDQVDQVDVEPDESPDEEQDESSTPSTIIRVHYDSGFGQSIALRGDGDGLSWTEDAVMEWTPGNIWVYESQSWTEPVRFKPVFVEADGSVSWAAGSDWVVGPEQELEVYPFFFAAQGRVEQVAVPSAIYGQSRLVELYLPPGYDELGASEKEYDILLAHDGQNLFDPNAFFGGWRLDESLDRLHLFGHIGTGTGYAELGSPRDFLVVGPHNSDQRLYEYTPTSGNYPGCDPEYDICEGGGGGDEYLDFLADELRPWIEARYRVRSGELGIAGSSLGGLISLYACWTRPELFRECAVLSPSLWWQDGYMQQQVASYSGAQKDIVLYLDAGTSSDGLDRVRQTYSTLIDMPSSDSFTPNQDILCLEGIGQEHNELAWALRVPWALAFLYADPARPPASEPSLPAELRTCAAP
jgi:predicted alpha/beta superfamily hydrolase